MHELTDMLPHVGLWIPLSKCFLGEDTQDCQQTARQSMIDWAKVPFYIVPHLRGSLLVVARKP
jgi:hypothetical protein